MTVLGIIITAIALVVGYVTHMVTHKTDSPVEQMAEDVIEKESGIKLDFSAGDKEVKPQDPNEPPKSV